MNLLPNPEIKIMLLDAAVKWRDQLARDGKKLVVTNGCFDILHRGHAEYLYKARSCGDALMVFINADSSIRELKGPSRPVNDEQSRAFILSSLFYVDSIVVFSESRCTNLFTSIRPDIYVKGADYNIDTINKEEKTALLAIGAKIEFIDLTPGFSTTRIIADLS
jgi:D-glycero-beta-D-manno-heptose 1-phosphate adenylyltransferase